MILITDHGNDSLSKKDFLMKNPLQVAVFKSELKQFNKILIEVNERHPLSILKKGKAHKYGRATRYVFDLYSPVTTFAEAYFYFGRLFASIIKKRKV